MINILVLNAGSSSLKFQLLEMPSENVLIIGQVERIGFKDAITQFVSSSNKQKEITPILDHKEALN